MFTKQHSFTQQIHTVFFGGGTPSVIEANKIGEILSAIHSSFTLAQDCEISLEANPGTVDLQKLSDYRKIGINRISFGVQSLIDQELAIIGRIHNRVDAMTSIQWALDAGFRNINADIMFGIPGQTIASLRETVERLIGFGISHLSAYSLLVEPETKLKQLIEEGKLPAPDLELTADMYEALMDWLDVSNFDHYEISNWAARSSQQNHQCRHNLQYWRNNPWIGFGSGAYSFYDHQRLSNPQGIEPYITWVDAEKTRNSSNDIKREIEIIPKDLEMDETMMLGLRLTQEGISKKRFTERFGCAYDELYPIQINKLISVGLLEYFGQFNDCLRLTRRGICLGNQVFKEFLRNKEGN